MREIKYRAWIEAREFGEVKKFMVNLTHLEWNEKSREVTCVHYRSPHRFDCLTRHEVQWTHGRTQKDVIIMQYTGLKDKNGKEIYEGDIVVDNNSLNGDMCGVTHLVYWDNDKKGWALKNNKRKNPTWYFAEEEQEVIGNIYENPELIEEKDKSD